MTDRDPQPEPPADEGRPRASVLGSIGTGWRRAVGAPWVAAGVLAASLLVAVPLASMANPDVPSQGFANALAIGADNAIGLDGAIGAATRLLDSGPLALPVLSALGGSLVVSLFLSGGILDRLARGRPVGTSAFFSACGVYGLRFLRLVVCMMAVSWALIAAFRPFIEVTIAGRAGVPVVGRDSFVVHPVLSLGFMVALTLTGVIVDFAMVRVVVEDRHSAVQALVASVRFVRRRVARVLTLYLVNLLLVSGVAMAWLFATLPPGSPVWARDIVSSAFLLLIVFARLAFAASEAVFFQGELAHAHYTAAPVPTWPESAAAEAIMNLTMSGQRAEGTGQK